MVEMQDKQIEYTQSRRLHWDQIAEKRHHWNGAGGRYHRRLQQIYANLVPSGMRVLEIGCADGNLLAAIKPTYGVGIDFSQGMVDLAAARHPDLIFKVLDAHVADQLGETFDFIILSDLVNDLYDVQMTLEAVKKLSHPGTRLIINVYSRMWQLPLGLAEKVNLATPNLEQSWFTVSDLASLLSLAGFEVIHNWIEMLFPLPIPLLNDFLDRFLVRLWPFSLFGLTNLLIARPEPAAAEKRSKSPSVSVIVPARNEAGNVPAIFARIPEMGSFTEIIFVEGNSTDDTYAAIERELPLHPNRKASLYKQPGKGKADAVRVGFDHASGDILMILDADLTVPPEDLPRFYTAIASGKGEFINGVRLVYPMEEQAMQFFNLLGNKFFSLAFSWLLGQDVKDTLCGTKVLWKKDYQTIAANRAYFGDFDPFGDFDLLFGASQDEPEDRRSADPLPRTDIRQYQYFPMETRHDPAADGRIRSDETQIHLVLNWN